MQSDALVFFGSTGDLAVQEDSSPRCTTWPGGAGSTVPVIGVAKAGVDAR